MAAQGSLVRVGIVSDTHGPLDPRVHGIFEGVSRIIHAGDIGDHRVLFDLEAIAPVTAVLGNTDRAGSADIGARANIVVGGCRIVVVHDRRDAAVAGLPSDTRVVVSGHTHVPRIELLDGIWYVNPGSTSRPRSGSVPSVALLEMSAQDIDTWIVSL